MIALGIMGAAAAITLQADRPAEPRCGEHQLCVKSHAIRSLPNYRFHCGTGRKDQFTIAIAGEPVIHARRGIITPITLRLPAGAADNRYAPLAVDVGGTTRIVENFVASDGKATFYLNLSWATDRPLTDPSGEQDVRAGDVRYEINRGGAGGAMAKRYAAGVCEMMSEDL